ncbi:transporter substrate-binding domain-containing protein [Stutzerimonas sp. VN223-3]|uniref:substrate-binding periplasmic protein n=1 Tax=Stutzerimonas sp. VN223-3 TaxID=3384601 RepID=UPI0038B4AA59
MRCAVPLKSALITLLLVTTLAASAAAAKCDRLIATGGADNPPFLWRDPQNPKRLMGANADLLKTITDSLNLKLEVLYTGDADKALEEVRSGRVDLLVDAVLSTPELAHLDFIHPSISGLQIAAWVRNEPGFLYANRDDLSGQTGTYIASARFGSEFDAYVKNNLRLKSSPSLAEAMQNLLIGKTDYVLHERYSAVALAGPLGLLDDVQRLQPPVFSRGMHFAVAHDSACNGPWLRGQLAIKMTELRAAGVPQQLLAENLDRWKQQQLAPESNPQR